MRQKHQEPKKKNEKMKMKERKEEKSKLPAGSVSTSVTNTKPITRDTGKCGKGRLGDLRVNWDGK